MVYSIIKNIKLLFIDQIIVNTQITKCIFASCHITLISLIREGSTLFNLISFTFFIQGQRITIPFFIIRL